MALVKFYKGLRENLSPLTPVNDPNSFYIATDTGEIFLGNKIWRSYDFYKRTIVDVVPLIQNNYLKLVFSFLDGANPKTVTLFQLQDTPTSNINIDENGVFTVDVKISSSSTRGENVIINSGGLYASIRPKYNSVSGVLNFQYWNGSAWVDTNSGSVNLELDSWLLDSTFVKDQAEYDAWAAAHGYPATTIVGPSIVFIMENTQAHENVIVVPVDDLMTFYTFTDSSSINFTTGLETNQTIDVTADVSVYNSPYNATELVVTDDGLECRLLLGNTETINLEQGEDMLKAHIINKMDGGLYTDDYGEAIKIDNTYVPTDGHIQISTSTAGIKSQIVWGTF
jgi:hypothetical protein